MHRIQNKLPGRIYLGENAAVLATMVLSAIMVSAFAGRTVLAAEERMACAQYRTQAAAQRAFDADPTYYKKLDHDHDGKACESLP